MQKIKPFLWFNDQAKEAATFYVSLFKNSKITSDGDMVVAFELDGQEFLALNGGPQFDFTPAVSLYITCETQAEVDDLWTKLTDGGEPGRCGWLKDRFGLSWQVIPTALSDMLQDEDDAKSERVMQAMFQMSKIEIDKLKAAYDHAVS
ncbi:MAG TPA: VOC family protein [Candidatus Elarobacter sp.]|jgi:predicted 3-demethylubiquinone-9 3-methyltransferase (glyoxalase superfamily)|nr:VOC family protein [Candidatus Elarobacter sp.]